MAPWLQPHSNTDAGSQAINQSLYPKLPFDSVKDFQTVATLAVTPFFLIVNPSVPASDAKITGQLNSWSSLGRTT